MLHPDPPVWPPENVSAKDRTFYLHCVSNKIENLKALTPEELFSELQFRMENLDPSLKRKGVPVPSRLACIMQMDSLKWVTAHDIKTVRVYLAHIAISQGMLENDMTSSHWTN